MCAKPNNKLQFFSAGVIPKVDKIKMAVMAKCSLDFKCSSDFVICHNFKTAGVKYTVKVQLMGVCISVVLEIVLQFSYQ